MIVRIRYFGRFAMVIGKFSEEIEVPDEICVREFITLLRDRYPVLKNEEIEVSMNGKYVKLEEKISKDISIYPPISGG